MKAREVIPSPALRWMVDRVDEESATPIEKTRRSARVAWAPRLVPDAGETNLDVELPREGEVVPDRHVARLVPLGRADDDRPDCVLDRTVLIVGREAGSVDLVIPDTAISKRHAQIVFDAGRSSWYIVDLASTNGTFVNDRRVVARVLRPGDEVRFHRKRYLFQFPAE